MGKILSTTNSDIDISLMGDQYIAFLDVLGFKELLKAKNFEKLNDYFNKIGDVLNQMHEYGEITSFLISDSIILITPPEKKDLKNLINAVRRIQQATISRSILTRGAVTKGKVYFDDKKNIVVGDGFIRAYLLEQQAIFPRVIIDPAIIKDFDSSKMAFLKFMDSIPPYNYEKRLIYCTSIFKLVNDDAIFIDYANKLIRKDRLTSPFVKLQESILENLYSEQILYSKFTWLKQYFFDCLCTTRLTLQAERTQVNDDYITELNITINNFDKL